ALARSRHGGGSPAAPCGAALRGENGERCRPPLPEREVEGLAAKAAVQPDRCDFADTGTRQPGAPSNPALESNQLRSPTDHHSGLSSFRSLLSSVPWPEPPAPEAFHGLAADIVRAFEPQTEADSVALLLQVLIGLAPDRRTPQMWA